MKRKIYKIFNGAKLMFFALALLLFSGTVCAQNTFTFNYTGGQQTISLPAGNYSFQCWGANGGDGSYYSSMSPNNIIDGGKGGYSSGTYSLSSSATLHVLVGGQGINTNAGNNPGGYNGGGNSSSPSFVAGSGGGASHIATAPGLLSSLSSNQSAVLIVAGGGGGGGNQSLGGNGGGLNGVTPPNNTQFLNRTPGGGGSQTSGGACYNLGFGAAFGQGGTTSQNLAGGGGGGWYGGCSGDNSTGGGGGSGYIGGVSNATTIVFGQPNFVAKPVVTGHGMVIITRLCNITVGTTSGISSVCQGAAVTLTTDAISNYTWSTGSNANSITVSPGVTTTYSLTAMSPSNCMTSSAITITVSAAAPVLTVATSTNSVCFGNTVTISASGALTYSISGGVTNNVPFIPSATTVYTVQGQNGCGIATAFTTVSVSALPVTAITSNTVVCSGNTATLSAGGATTYSWQPGNLSGANVIVSPFNSTTYTVVGTTGLCAGFTTIAVNTNPVPSLSVSVSQLTLCAGESSTLTATGALNYTWTPGGTGSVIVVSPLVPTAYNVVGANSFGCTSNLNQPVIAYAGPNMNIAASSTLICAGSVVTLNSNGATTYNWSNGATTAITTATPASTTIYTVVGSSPNSQCSTTKTIEIQVFTATISVSNPTAICLGELVSLSASGADTYNWSNGGVGSSINVSPAATTVYTVNGVSSTGSGTCASSAVTTVTVNPLPTVLASSTRSNICRGESTSITASGAGSYSWNTGATTASIVVSPTVQTTFTVTGTDANGCKNTVNVLIRVYTCVGLEDQSEAMSSISIYPNPSSGEFNISGSESMRLQLINELGQKVSELELNAENAYTAEVKGLAKGVYFLISTSQNLPMNKKIVVQ